MLQKSQFLFVDKCSFYRKHALLSSSSRAARLDVGWMTIIAYPTDSTVILPLEIKENPWNKGQQSHISVFVFQMKSLFPSLFLSFPNQESARSSASSVVIGGSRCQVDHGRQCCSRTPTWHGTHGLTGSLHTCNRVLRFRSFNYW